MPANLQILNRALVLLVSALFYAAPARAQGARLDLTAPSWAEITAKPFSQSPPEISQRLTFLEQRLDAAQLHGQIWYYGWFAVNSGGLIVSTVQAATTHSHDDRISTSVEAGKAVIGVMDLLLRPLPARLGADPIRTMPGSSPRERVQAAETLLQASATRAEFNRTRWPHLGNAILNLIGGGIVLAFGDWKDAALTTGLDFVVGEIQLLTEPSRAIRDLAAYRSRYGELPKPTESWHLSPSLHGVTVTFRF